MESATRDICELATPTISTGHRRVQPGLASSASLRLPSICPDPALPRKNQERSSRADVGSALLANSAVVPFAIGTSMRNTTGHSPTRESSSRTNRVTASPPVEGRPPFNRLAVIRSKYEARNLPEGVIKYLLALGRSSTSTTYQSTWNAWLDWCVQRDQDPLSPALNAVLTFLCSLAESGKAYRTINVYRSMLSVTVHKIEGFDVGKHPLVMRLMKGISNLIPPSAKSKLWVSQNFVASFH